MIIEDLLHLYGHYQRITLVAQHKQTKKYWFLFSVIELLTRDNDNYDSLSNLNWHTDGQHESIRSNNIKNSDCIFYIVKEKGVAGSVINSFLHPSSDNILKDEIVDILNDFNLEPNGASPLVIQDNTYAKNGLGTVLPKYKSGCMVWTQIDLNRVTQRQFLTDVYKKSLSELTLNTLGFDINIHSEHIGNMYLVAPNPYIRDIDTHLSLNPPGIYYKLFRRKNICEELTIRITDRHQNHILVYEKDFKLNDNVGLIELPCEPHCIELKILNANKDVIFISGPHTFIRSIRINMSVGGKQLVLENIDKNGQTDTTTISKFEPTNPINIGNNKSTASTEEFFAQAQNDREYIVNEESRDFIFFPGQSNHETPESQKNNAKNVVREIINRANNTCYLCDPYFSSRDLIDFAYHIQNMGVKIRILNCKEYVKIAEAKVLNTNIKEYNSKLHTQAIECRSLKGKGILHDRFIITDDNIWFLGSSFNEFGKRATCISKIPKSSGREIIKKIESWYQDDNISENIEHYKLWHK